MQYLHIYSKEAVLSHHSEDLVVMSNGIEVLAVSHRVYSEMPVVALFVRAAITNCRFERFYLSWRSDGIVAWEEQQYWNTQLLLPLKLEDRIDKAAHQRRTQRPEWERHRRVRAIRSR